MNYPAPCYTIGDRYDDEFALAATDDLDDEPLYEWENQQYEDWLVEQLTQQAEEFDRAVHRIKDYPETFA